MGIGAGKNLGRLMYFLRKDNVKSCGARNNCFALNVHVDSFTDSHPTASITSNLDCTFVDYFYLCRSTQSIVCTADPTIFRQTMSPKQTSRDWALGRRHTVQKYKSNPTNSNSCQRPYSSLSSICPFRQLT